MKRIMVFYPPVRGVINYSLKIVADNVYDYLSMRGYSVRVLSYSISSIISYSRSYDVYMYIADCIDVLRWIKPRGVKIVIWCDTAIRTNSELDKLHARMSKIPDIVWLTTSKYNKMILENDLDIESDILPRPVDSIYVKFRRSSSKTYDIAYMGYKAFEWDRKNVEGAYMILSKLASLGYRLVIISNHPALGDLANRYNNVEYHESLRLDRYSIFRLLSSSKWLLWISKVEGFGLPVAEAMSVGTPAIYSDAPAHNEYVVGVKLKTRKIIYRIGSSRYIELYDTIIDNDNMSRIISALNREDYDKIRLETISVFDQALKPDKIIDKLITFF